MVEDDLVEENLAHALKDCLSGLFWGATAIAVWSGSLVLVRLGVTTSLNAYDLTAIRFGVAALILAPVALRRGFAIGRLGIGGVLIMVAGFGAPYVLSISLALETAPASAGGTINPGAMAVASAILGWMFFRDRIGMARIVGITLIVAALACFARPEGEMAIGHLILVGTGLMWAGYAAIVRRARIPALQATAIVAVGSAILYLPVYLIALPRQILDAPLTDVLAQAGFQGILVSVLAIFAFNRSTELLGPLAGAALPALIPSATLGLGSVVLGEPAGLTEIVSAALTCAGVALILAGQLLERRSGHGAGANYAVVTPPSERYPI